MDSKKPDITDEDIGMRTFQIRKAKAVERATERLRQGNRNSWSLFTQRDLADLSWMLGELWAYESREDWDNLHFSKLTPDDVLEIVAIARELQADSHNTVDALKRVGAIVRAKD